MSVRGKTQAQAAQTTAVATVNPHRSRVHQPIRPLKPVTSTPMSTMGPATPVQRAQASVALQRQIGNARVSAMKSETALKPVIPVMAPVVAASKATLAAVPLTRKPPDVQAKGAPVTAVPASKAPSTPPSKLKTSAPAVSDEAIASSASALASVSPQQDKVSRAEITAESGETKSKGALPKGEKGAQGGQQTEEAPAGAAQKEAGGEGMPAVKLRMPEPPTEVSPATAQRIRGVQTRAGGAATAHAALPSGASQVGDARQAVTEPDAEATARAQADLIEQVQAAPSPEIVKLCERIKEVIRKKRPPDQDALMEAKPESEALNAGNQLNSTVEGETKKVQDNYGAVNAPPAAVAPTKGEELPSQPAAAQTAPVNAQAATPDAVPPGNVSLDADAADSKKKMQDAGMDTPAAQLVQSGPIAEARGAQGELDQAAKEDPAQVLAKQQEALAKAEGDMAALQAQALAALTTSRATTEKGATSRQQGMVGSEESMRANAGAEAKKIFDDAKNQVTKLLEPLAANAMAEWDAAKEVLTTQFKNDLAIVQKRVDERHSGVGGWFVGLWDAVTGLPSWAEEAYTKAETNFGDGVIAKLTAISTKVNSVIATCDLIIKSARERIAKIFADLPESLKGWAAGEQAKFDGQLDQLHNQVIATRDNFNKDLVDRSSQAVDEVRAEIAELRKKAGGLVGRIVSAVNRFLEDPVKFIIEGLLELLGIQPAAFWAVVAKIKKVVKDIADDPMKFANNLLAGLAAGFTQFFDNILSHLLKGFIGWLTGGLGDVGVQLPKDASLKSLITFFLQLMGITWPRIRKILAKHVGEKNVALLEKVYSLVSLLIEKGPEGIYEMIKEKLDPQSIVDQVIQLAVDFLISAVVKAVSARIILLFNPAGAILQALEAIYRVLKWIFQNAARIFTLIETVVNGVADILAGSIGGFANAVEKALGMLIAPVISFLADYLGFGDLPGKIAEKIKSFQEWILGLIEKALVWIIEKGKALLAAVGIGKKEEKKPDKAGTPHEKAVDEVAQTLAEPPPGPPLAYDELRAAKEKEAATIVAARNSSLAAEHVKMSITFGDKTKDQQDADLDFEVVIAPNNATSKAAVPVTTPEPIAGLHRVTRDPAIPGEKAESHHVPARALGVAIADFLDDMAGALQKGKWKTNPTAQDMAKEYADRATSNRVAAKSPGFGLSAMLVDASAHREDEGVHTVEGSGPVLQALASSAGKDQVVIVKRKTETEINGVTSYVSVNPRTENWRLFLADIRRSMTQPGFQNKPNIPPGEQKAVELIILQAEEEFEAADEETEAFLQTHVLDRTNRVMNRAVTHAYTAGRSTMSAALERAKVGTPGGRAAALSSLDRHFTDSWEQFRVELG